MSNVNGLSVISDNVSGFEYRVASLRDLQVQATRAKSGRQIAETVAVDGEQLAPSKRFWTSLYSRYGFSESIFKYFGHAEVFDRISTVHSDDLIRLTVERDNAGNGRLLGVSGPDRPLIQFDDLIGLVEGLEKGTVSDLTYHDGVVQSVHHPHVKGGFKVVGDAFENRFALTTPIDGFGRPSAAVSLLRMICTNGVIASAPAFRSEFSLGKKNENTLFALNRAIEGFNNDEGFAAIRQRIESSTQSWASINEVQSLYEVLLRSGVTKVEEVLNAPQISDKSKNLFELLNVPTAEDPEVYSGTGSPILFAFERLTGRLNKLYGLANLDSLSQKRQRTLPAKCTVYDLLNFATELGSHYSQPSASRALSAWVGSTLAAEYDMEGTKKKVGSFSDFYVNASLAV